MVSSYTFRTFSRRVSSREEEEEGEFVRWGKKGTKKNLYLTWLARVRFIERKADRDSIRREALESNKERETHQRFQNAALPARLTPNDSDLR